MTEKHPLSCHVTCCHEKKMRTQLCVFTLFLPVTAFSCHAATVTGKKYGKSTIYSCHLLSPPKGGAVRRDR